jgi:hypothetical protein
MPERFAVALNRGSIRIYRHSQPVGQTTPGLQPVQQLDIPAGRTKFNHYLTDQAGRHPSQPHQGPHEGMSIDERLPGQQEHEKRVFDEVAREVEAFFSAHPQAEWDFAAPPGVHQAVMERLSDGLRQRIRRALTKDLTNLPPAEVREHFTA